MIKLRTTCLLALVIALQPFIAHGQTPQLAFPVDCTLNEDCWVVNYVDTNSAQGEFQDFTCGHKTHDGHKGTDIALQSRADMQAGVDVRAVKDGKVLRFRDGEDDNTKTPEQLSAIQTANKDCGNGIILDHGNGLQSYYCHLKQNSIRVKNGQTVKQGDAIAQIGQSGYSEFPHLHLTIIWEGGHIDPFTGMLMEDGCGQFKNNMWEDNLSYDPYSIYDGGFADKVPDFRTIPNGHNAPKTLPLNSKALVYWVAFYNAHKGDKITLTIRNPNGKIFAKREETLTGSRNPPSYYYTGRKITGTPLQPGKYTGTIRYEKSGHPAKTQTHVIEIR